MASQEKFHKSLEALKNFSNSNQTYDVTSRKKEKIQHCHVITDAISNPTIKVSPNFQQILSSSIEILLKLCDDPESDIRMISEECLNRIIRAVSDENIGKIQIELHKEIKRNGSARSLRAALIRFAQLAHLIKPHKGKPYVANLFPSIIKITERSEEQIHETLALSLPKIMTILGCFSPDNEIKVLLKAFLVNISNQSAVIRRTTSNCILSICMHCRKPYVFITNCLNNLLDLVVPITDNQNTYLILGVMTALKTLLPNVNTVRDNNDSSSLFDSSQKSMETVPVGTEKFLQIYELCLHYLTHSDHNIINACLETLNVLLQNCTDEFKSAILCQNGIGKSRIICAKSVSMLKLRSPSQLSVATTTTLGDENLFVESELTDTIHSDIEKWIDESKLSVMNITYAKPKEDFEKSLDNSIAMSDLETASTVSDYTANSKLSDNYVDSLKSRSFGDNLDRLTLSENSSEKSCSCAGEEKGNSTECESIDVDIGDFLDKDISLVYCIRLITKCFLLTGHPGILVSDKSVRVSVKSLALTCLSTIVRIYPRALLEYLANQKTVNKNASLQKMTDVLLFSDHNDPQLRGLVRVLLANFIKSVLIENNGNYDQFIEENNKLLLLPELVRIFIKGLEDESSNCTKQTLSSLKIVLPPLLELCNSFDVRNILNVLPVLAKNPYWLIKVELCELVSKLCYVTIFHITNSSDFQNKVIFNVLFELLKDSDQRVRSSAAGCIVTIIPNLYSEQYKTRETPVTTKAVFYKNKYLKNLWNESQKETNLNKKHFVENMPFPFRNIEQIHCKSIEYSLSKIILKLYNFILTYTSKNFISGCIETLSLLSNAYPSTMYTNSWMNFKPASSNNEKQIPDLLNLCVNLLNSSIISYDITCQINILNLSSNLYAGQTLMLIRPVPDVENTKQMWDMFSNPPFSQLSEEYLLHVVKLLNIFHHVLYDIVPVPPQSKNTLQNLPTAASNLSPLKRRKSDLDKKFISSGKIGDKDEKGEKKCAGIGTFFHCPHYMKIYDVLRNSFTNYKTSLESEASEKFVELLRKTLSALSILMEIGTLTEFGRIAEEVLNYLRSIFVLDSSASVECVQQLLKCLFGTNLAANISEILNKSKKIDNVDETSDSFGFYYNVSQKPYNEITNCINALRNINRIDCDSDSTVMGYLHRKDIKKPTTLSKSSEKTLANYIKIFEPMVIKSLKQYTITSDVKLQCRVLQLLSQLVQLRVNYCLLDREQVFIGFVFKQFEFIEDGQIPYPHELIPKIFQFLVQLSYSKQHSKCIISVPKIIQLCDGLMASGQSPITHCIPALEPIVEDIFLTRNKSNTSDIKELETTREVVLSMLLRLCEHHQVIDFITLILEDSKYCSDNPEKWLRWSKQVLGVILPMLKLNKIRLNDSSAFVSFKRFIFSLNPNIFKPIDEVIKMLFQEPPPLDTDLDFFSRWLSKILIILLILIPIKEDVLLSKISDLKSEFSPNTIFENITSTADPLNVNNSADIFDRVSPELIIIRYIFRIITITTQKCLEVAKHETKAFLIEQFSTFLMYCLHVFQSGSHCKLTNVAASVVNKNGALIDENEIELLHINSQFINLSVFYPTLTFQWCYFLTLLNYNNRMYWSSILQVNESEFTDFKINCINLEITKVGGAVAYCDYLSENTIDIKELSWILQHNIHSLINLCEEPPIFEFISSVHRNSVTSKILIETITEHCLNIDDPVFKSKILKCVENTHQSQIGSVLNLLLPKMLNYRQISLSRMVANLASRKVELLLTLPMEEVNNQLSKENLMQMKKLLVTMNLVKKHEALVSLLNKLSTQFYDLSPLEFDQRRVVNPEYIKRLKINKKWYLTQIQGRYNDINTSKETAQLLNKLEYNEIVSFMTSSEFNKLCIQDCISLGVEMIKKFDFKEEPVIVKASVDCLTKDLSSIRSRLPKPHQVYEPFNRNASPSELKYTSALNELFRNEEFFTLLHNLTPSISCYIRNLPFFPIIKIPDNCFEDIVKFAVISLESINHLIECDRANLNINLIDAALNCTDFVLKESHLCSILALDTHISWLCSAVNSIFKLINFLLHNNDEPLPSIPKYSLKDTLENLETVAAGQACYQLYILICWLHKIKKSNVNIPDFLFKPVKSIIIALSRLPFVNSYILIPAKVWSTGWCPELSGPFNTQVPPLPIEFLQEIDVLEEYIFRMTLLGWTSRQQFEETWMCLLSVLCAPIDDVEPSEVNDVVHASSLAIKSITALLLQTMCLPIVGNNNVSKLIHVSRDVPINDEIISIRKLKFIHQNIRHKYEESARLSKDCEFENVFNKGNFEKFSKKYSYGQISIKYLLTATKTIDEGDNNVTAIYKHREKLLDECGLDINSCLQFLIDYYTQLMKPQSMTNLRLLYEAVRSTVMISDLFTDKSQFTWMLEVFFELSKLHVDDDLLAQYLIIGICKAAAVITPDLETFEQVKKLLVQYLKNSLLPVRIACLHGLLYILEGCKLSNITIGGISDEMQIILPCAVEYVQCHLNTTDSVLKKSKEHTHLIWSLAFYIIENVDEIHMELNFVTNTLQTAFTLLQLKFTNSLHKAIIKGLERLMIVKRNVMEKMGKHFLKLAMDKMKHDNPAVSIRGIQLLLSYMYTDCAEHLENTVKSGSVQTNPDHLVQTIEKISAIFERIKKCYVIEVEILCSILPIILQEFFTPSDILTKVIGEFLSPQQPHPKFLSRVVFQIFEYAIEQEQLSLLQDWVVFSLSNFTQSSSIGMATWCLTCFFISASSNEWLRSLFPYVQARVGRYEYEDKKMLCVAGVDFYNNLSESQKQTFIDNFRKVKDLPDMPFSDLLSSL